MLGNDRRLPRLFVAWASRQFHTDRYFGRSHTSVIFWRLLLFPQGRKEFRRRHLRTDSHRSMNSAVTVSNISKQYRIGLANRTTTLRESHVSAMTLPFLRRNPREDNICALGAYT